MPRLSLLGLLLSVTLAVPAEAKVRGTYDYQFQVNEALELDLHNVFGDHPVTTAELGQLATTAGSYDAFLAALKQRQPDFYDNYVLLHGTGSLQPATPAAPRVLLFADGLVLALSEDPAASERRVEVLAFDAAAASFHLAEIRFPAAAAAVFDPAPTACATCHGEATKPLWEPYDFWPTVYGAAISRPYSAEEKAAYQAFFASPSRRGVYAYLNDQAHADDDGKLDGVETFTLYLANLNFLRVARQMQGMRERIGPLETVLLGSIARCSDGSTTGNTVSFTSFFPQEVLASASKPYDGVLADVKAARRLFKSRLLERYGRQFPGYHVAYQMNQERLGKEATVAAQVRFLLENIGLDPSDFATSNGANRDFLSTPSNFGFDWLTALVTYDREGLQTMGAYPGLWVTVPCNESAKSSRELLRDFRFPKAPTPAPKPRQAVFGRCQGCHAYPTATTPHLPFDDTMALRRLLQERPGLAAEIHERVTASDGRRMPPDEALTPGEVAALDDVIARLRTP